MTDRITSAELAEIKKAIAPATLRTYEGSEEFHRCAEMWVNDLLAEVEAQAAEIETLRREKEAAISDCTGYCSSCAHVKDCALHDHNDSGPSTWMCGECDEWEWRGPAAEGEEKHDA